MNHGGAADTGRSEDHDGLVFTLLDSTNKFIFFRVGKMILLRSIDDLAIIAVLSSSKSKVLIVETFHWLK